MGMVSASNVTLRPWTEEDFWLIERTMGDATMTEHLGGAESPEKLQSRHARYCRIGDNGTGQMFVIEVGDDHTAAGSIGYWEHESQGKIMLETGWAVLPEFQRQGVATHALHVLIDHARFHTTYPAIHAYPSVDNLPSNAVCRKAGFTLQGTSDFEYPPGHTMRCNDWRMELQSHLM